MKRSPIFGFMVLLSLSIATELKAKEEPVALEATWGTLRGTLWSPDNPTDTAVILIAGSGPTDRYGNSTAGIRTQAYALLAEELMLAGIATLSYDKRGISASPYLRPEELIKDTCFGYYADDAEQWVEELAKRGYQQIFLAGHSEGALLAKIVATRNSRVSGVISLCGAAYPIDQILKMQLAGQLLAVDYTLYAQACRIIDILKRGEAPDQIPQSLASLFPPYLNNYYHEWMSYDPCALARELSCPLLIIAGGRDTQLAVSNARSLQEASPTAQIFLIEKMTHTLKESEGFTTQEQIDAYTNPSLPLAKGVVERILDFVSNR